MEIELFIGRFHPLLVHLPIGIILFTLFLEFVEIKSGNQIKAIFYGYLLSFVFALFAILTGFMLSDSGSYFPSELNIHKWFAISLIPFTLFMTLQRYFNWNISALFRLILLILLVSITSITGHLGGNLTHGSEFLLEYAPGNEKPEDITPFKNVNTNVDSINVYTELIEPLITQKCAACHNQDYSYGGLDLSHYKNYFISADAEVPITKGKAESSELYKRIILPASDPQFMPRGHAPLSYPEILLVKYWINSGADSLSRFDRKEISSEFMAILENQYGLDLKPKPYYEVIKADSLSPRILDSLNQWGWKANFLGENNYFLDVKYEGDTLLTDALVNLTRVKDNISLLDLSGKFFPDSLLIQLPTIQHLISLDLHSSNVSDSLFPALDRFPNLSILNLHSTAITSKGLSKWISGNDIDEREMKIYCWNTGLTNEEIIKFQTDYPQIDWVGQFTFVEPDTTKLSKFSLDR